LKFGLKKLLLLVLLFATSDSLGNPFFTIGSNFYLTIFAYPHDILKWPNRGVFLLYNPQALPWQGDVTDIHNRPSESYINNYQEVEFAPPYGYVGNPEDVRSWMRVAGYAYNTKLALGGLYGTGLGKLYVELERASLDMELSAEGMGRAYEDVGGNTEYYMVPFKGQTNAQRDNYTIKVIYANHLFNNPFGLKFRYSKRSSGRPDGYV
jgi:hypothetical protein